jgi:aspartate aminotransferase
MALAFTPSSNIALLRESATIAVSQRAKALKAEGRAIIDLGAGEPDCDTPRFIREAAKASIDAGHTHYTPTEGILPLRTAIAELAREYGPVATDIAPLDVVVSNGSKQSLFNACFCLFGPGDEVLIPTPSWTSYYEMVQLARGGPGLGDGRPGQRPQGHGVDARRGGHAAHARDHAQLAVQPHRGGLLG